jgi:hypothetical protein
MSCLRFMIFEIRLEKKCCETFVANMKINFIHHECHATSHIKTANITPQIGRPHVLGEGRGRF